MATSATNWRDSIQNYVGEDPGTRSWSNLRDKSYSRYFYPNFNITGYYQGYQILYSRFNRCLGLSEGLGESVLQDSVLVSGSLCLWS